MPMRLITRDDLPGIVAIVVFMVLVLGFAGLLLWLRDRGRDRRGVPGWVRQLGELQASRLGAAYAMLLHVGLGISCALSAFRVSNRSFGILLLICGGIIFWTSRGNWKAYQRLGRQIKILQREGESKQPFEPLG
jgi:hypothetical protein